MESTAASKSKPFIITAIVLAVAACLAILFLWTWEGLPKAHLSAFVRGDLPMLALDLQFIDINRNEIPAGETRLANETPVPGKLPVPGADACPEIIGGDIRGGSEVKAGDRLSDKCPKTVKWVVKRHPIGMSLYFAEPQKVLSFVEKNNAFNEIRQSRFVQGIFHDPLRNAGIRAEDLGLEGLEGKFIATLAKESIAAHGQLHYDAVHGRKGFVYSFVRNECPYAAKALPVICRVLARSGYKIPKLKEPILEMSIGLQRIFITEYETRVFVSNGLEALINVLESIQPLNGTDAPNTPIVLSVRAEAFVDNLLPVMIGRPAFQMDLGFGLSGETPDVLCFPAGKLAGHLRPRIFKGVLAAIPHDAFAAVAASFHLPPDMPPEAWRKLALEGPADPPETGPEETGVAFIWDLSSEGAAVTNMGVVIANQSAPDAVQRFRNLFADPKLTASCGGGTVFLAATSELLLTRMKESCERQSLSVLDWEKGSHAEAFTSRQLLFFLNPGAGMRELFLAGGARSSDQIDSASPWKQQYEKAKAGMRKDSETVFAGLPIFAFSGNAAQATGTVALKGITVRQGAPK
ncbi:MAG: hypothetical protein V1844_12880 [Pseudomonadota bacterium]